MLRSAGRWCLHRLGHLTLVSPGEFRRVALVLFVKAGGEVDEVPLSATSLVVLHVLVILAVASLVEFQRGQRVDTEALGDVAVSVGVDDGKADVGADFLCRRDPIGAGQVAVIAPGRRKHDHPDFVATLNDVVKVIVVQVDDLTSLEVGGQIRVGDVLEAVLSRAEVVDGVRL